MRKKRIYSPNLPHWALFLALALMITFALFPILVMVLTSLKPAGELLTADAQMFPKEATLSNYEFLFNIPKSDTLYTHMGEGKFLKYILHTLGYALVSSLIAIPLAVFAAYALSKLRFRGKPVLICILLFCYLLPTTAMILPLFQMLSAVKLYNNALGVIITYQLLILPLNVWMLATYFKNIPIALVDAGRVDGLSHVGAIIKIFVPVSAPGIAAVTVFSFVVVWQEFMYNLILVKSTALRNIQVGMQSFFQNGVAVQWGVVMAASTIVAIPLALLFAYMRQHIIGGLMVGSVKG